MHPLRRGACPGLSAPMQTGDGLLVRHEADRDRSHSTAFAKLCAAAQAHGNGIIEITARGSIQVRGLSEQSAPLFAEAVAAARHRGGRRRSGADQSARRPRSGGDFRRRSARRQLRTALAENFIGEETRAESLRRRSTAAGASPRWHSPPMSACAPERRTTSAVLHVAHRRRQRHRNPLGAVAADDGVEAALRLLDVIARVTATTRARATCCGPRSMTLPGGHHRFADRPMRRRLRAPAEASDRHSSATRGIVSLCGIGLAFGHADADVLERLVRRGGRAGAGGMRTAPGRGAADDRPHQPARRTSLAAAPPNLGFIISADDPRRHVFACAGAPICASAHIAGPRHRPARSPNAAAPDLGGSSDPCLGLRQGLRPSGQAALTIVGAPTAAASLHRRLACARDIPLDSRRHADRTSGRRVARA